MVEASGARGWPRNRRCLGMVWECRRRGRGEWWRRRAERVGRRATGVAQHRDAAPPSTEMRRRPAQRCGTARHSASVPSARYRARYTEVA